MSDEEQDVKTAESEDDEQESPEQQPEGGSDDGFGEGSQFTPSQSSSQTERAATDLSKKVVRGTKSLASKALKPVKDLGKKIGQGFEKLAKAAANKVKQGVRWAAKQVGQLIAKLSMKIAAWLIGIGWPFLVAIFFIVIIVAAIVFMVTEEQKAGAYALYGNTVSSYCKDYSTEYTSKGYTSMGGLAKKEFETLVCDDGAIMTGTLPEKNGMTEEQKKLLDRGNKVRKANFKDFSTDEERERLVIYLQADRDSTLKSPIQKSTLASILEFVDNNVSFVLGKFFNIWSDYYKTAYPEDEKRDPRMEFNNNSYDVAAMYASNPFNPIDEPDEWEACRHEISKVVNQINNIKGSIQSDGDNMKKVKEFKLIINGTNFSAAPCTENDIKSDELFRKIEPYALQWQFLYLLDKALDEDEFDNQSNMETEGEEKAVDKMRKMLIRSAIPRFMPEFDVVRHFSHVTNSNSWSSWPATGSTSGGSSGGSSSNEFVPIYSLEYYNTWSKEEWIPMATVEVYHEDYYSIDNSDGSGHRDHNVNVHTILVPYETSMNVNDYISGSPDHIIPENLPSNVTQYDVDYQKVVSIPTDASGNPIAPETNDKKEEIKKLFKEQFKINKLDIEHGIYLAMNAPEFVMICYQLANVFDIQIQNYANITGPGSYIASLQHILDQFGGDPNYKIVPVLQQLLQQINSKCVAAGIPASALIAQAIWEAGWDLPNAPVSQAGHNLFGIKCDWGHGKTSDGFAIFTSYDECIDAYIHIITNEYAYAVQAAKTGGPEAYIRALQFPPAGVDSGHIWCASGTPQDYVNNLLTILRENQLVDMGSGIISNGVPLYSQGDSRWQDDNGDNDNTYSMARTGCAITSCAMVASFYAGRAVTPLDIVRPPFDTNHNEGANDAFGEMAVALNLTYHSSSWNQGQAEQILASGNPVIIHQTVGSSGNANGFGGHYKVLTGVTNGGFTVNDPGKSLENGTYSETFTKANSIYNELHWFTRN